MGLVFVLSALCSYVYSRIMVRVSQRTVAALRQDLFDKLQELPCATSTPTCPATS